MSARRDSRLVSLAASFSNS